MNIKLSFLICFLVASDFICAKNTIDDVEIGQIWSLETRSNKLSVGNSKVLYFFSNDAYNTYQARIFSDWDRFSIIDSRNLVRLNKGDRIEILNSKHFEKIYEVKLLDGFEKNRKYYVIKDDLIRHYKLSKGEETWKIFYL